MTTVCHETTTSGITEVPCSGLYGTGQTLLSSVPLLVQYEAMLYC